jgi:hypothetical protein
MLCRNNVVFLNVKPDVTHSKHWAFTAKILNLFHCRTMSNLLLIDCIVFSEPN